MSVNIDNLVQRQAAIFAEIDSLSGEELESLANSPLPEAAVSGEAEKARKLLRGLLRTRNVGSDDLTYRQTSADTKGLVPAQPDLCFVINLMPLSDGSFDREQVIKTPVIAWEIDGGCYARPIIPGNPVPDYWAVLTPTGFVVADEYTNLFGEAPLALKDWIKSQIEWLEGPSGDVLACEYPTVCKHVFEYGGPLAKAFGLMMARRRDWTGTLEELYEALSKFHHGAFSEMAGWPGDLRAFAASLKELESKLADADLFVRQSDDKRLIIYRQSDETAVRGSLSSTLQ